MKKSTPVVSSLIICSLVTSIIHFAGCGRPGHKPNTVVIWHWMTDRDKAFQQLAQQYQQQTGIEVKFELYAPSDVYSQKIVAAAQARILPDIFGILDKKSVIAEFIKSGFVADLTADFTAEEGAWEQSFFPKALAVNRFEEGNIHGVQAGIYGVPIDVTNIQMLYNKNLLKKAGITRPPATFDEFLAAAAALKRVGIAGLVSGWGELWMIECFASNYAFNIMGEQKVMATFRGEIPYTDPDWIKVFQVFESLRAHKALIEGGVTKANKYAEQDFALERAAFAFNGSWCVNVYYDMNPDLDYGVMLPPPVVTQQPMRIWGGAGSSFMVNERSRNKDKAVAFLKWFTAKEQQAFLSQETRNLPANRLAITSIPKVLSEFAGAMDFTTHPTVWPLNEDALVLEAFDKGIQSIIIGEKSVEQVAQEVQQVKERQLQKQKARPQ
jgi:ABC-type glycerol-3-phosphate transport system substrate-binding protein